MLLALALAAPAALPTRVAAPARPLMSPAAAADGRSAPLAALAPALTPSLPALSAAPMAAGVAATADVKPALAEARAWADALGSASRDGQPPLDDAKPAAPKAAPIRGGKNAPPAATGVAFGDSVPAAHRALFDESLRRRRGAWLTQLKKVGVPTDGETPVFETGASYELGANTPHARVKYLIEWTQGPFKRGAFYAEIRQDTRAPLLLKTTPSQPERSRVLRLRLENESRLEALLRDNGITSLGRYSNGPHDRGWLLKLPRGGDAFEAALRLSHDPAVLSISPDASVVPESNRFAVAVVSDNPAAAAAARDFLAARGYLVLDAGADGRYLLGGSKYASESAARELREQEGFLFAERAARPGVHETRLAVVRFSERRELGAKDSAARMILRALGVRVNRDYGGRTFRVWKPRASGSELARELVQKGGVLVERAAGVGDLADSAVDEAVRRVGFHATGDYVAFETERMHQAYALELAGATQAQLAAFRAAIEAMPKKFSSTSTE